MIKHIVLCLFGFCFTKACEKIDSRADLFSRASSTDAFWEEVRTCKPDETLFLESVTRLNSFIKNLDRSKYWTIMHSRNPTKMFLYLSVDSCQECARFLQYILDAELVLSRCVKEMTIAQQSHERVLQFMILNNGRLQH